VCGLRADSSGESASPDLVVSTKSEQLEAGQFQDLGHWGPIRVLSEQDCRRFLQATVYGRPESPLDWPKGHAASSRVFYDVAKHPAILEILSKLIGEDIMLWGVSIQSRRPGQVHPWHSDIESSAPSSKTVAVWIGLEHASRESSLQFIPHSQHYGLTIQEARHLSGKGRNEAPKEEVLRWARERDGRAEIVSLDVINGDAMFFDGRLWHGSHNLFGKTRHALLLQYAPPDDPIRIPDLNFLDWPFKQLETPRPPCLLVQGQDKTGINRLVSAPAVPSAQQDAPLDSRIRPLQIPLPPPDNGEWQSQRIFRGRTAELETLSCHASSLTHDQSPHAPHTHKEEELLLMLAGEADILVPDDPDTATGGRRRLAPGEFVYYPTGFAHTLATVSPEPANYLMLKWHASSAGTDSLLPFGHFRPFEETHDSETPTGFQTRRIFEGATAYLHKLHCHATTLAPGAGYEPHVDAYDVAIIVMEGEVETLGERVGPHGVIFYRAGEAHGMSNPGQTTAKYLVFEFHGHRTGMAGALPKTHPLLVKLRPTVLKRRLRSMLPKKLRHVLKRFRAKISR
jgi:uncharacterized cupin superfamily protein